ncbi:MAG: thioredoxin family protein [Chitinophagaceae bacterium]|nr:thioredoxin family protein [Chitinophagaceae bacterium]
MKKVLFSFIAVFTFLFVNAQSTGLVWKVKSNRIADSTYEIIASTQIEQGWYMYASNSNIEGLENINFNYSLENVKPISEIRFNKASTTINDELFENKTVNVYTGDVEIKQNIKLIGFIPESIKIKINANIAKGFEFIPPSETEIEVALEGGAKATNNNLILSSVDIQKPVANCGDKIEKGSLWTVFLLGLFGGLIALFTPCMFPMIPVTVSFFTKRSPTRKAGIKNGLLYGFFIFLIYVVASAPFHLLNLNSEIFNSISTSPTLNIVFFLVFIVFAISFFGYFEITLPHSIAGKADSKSNLSSGVGIFFMALTLVIVSFSCTGVILGTLLVGTSDGGAWALTVGMGGFGLALGLPFALFAIFPNWLESLPKSGGWLDTVKKVLAFVEVALALKFLSNADLVMHWGLLKREVFIALWIVISLGLALYAFGFLRLPHDYKGQKISWGRKIIGLVAILFALYLAPGLTKTKYANLKLLSGILPPLSYSAFSEEDRFKGLEPNFINNYQKAIALAKEQKKPLLIDFTGWACANCRRMEEEIWTRDAVQKMIHDNFILVSLYVDDKEKLPIAERILNYKTKDGNVKDIITIGDKYATFESENFYQVSQPLYVILDNEEKLLTFPIGATFNEAKYLEWLQCGLKAFK